MPAFPALRTIRSHSTLLHTTHSITARVHITSQTNARPTPPHSVRLHTALCSRPLFPHFPQLSRWSACKDGAVQSFDSIPGFTRRVHGVNLNTNTVLVECVKQVFTRAGRNTKEVRSASAECSRFCVRALTSGQFLADTPISVSVMFH